MKVLIIKNPKKYHTILVKSKVEPKIVSDNKECFYFHFYNKENLCIHPTGSIPKNKKVDFVAVEIADDGYIQLWDNMTLLK